MKRLLDGYCRLLERAIGAVLAVLVVLVFGNVVLRYAFNSGFAVTEELGRWLFVWLVFMGAVVALHERAHLGSDLVVSRLGMKGKRVCLVIGLALMLHSTWLVTSGSFQQVVITRGNDSPVMGCPMSVLYGAGLLFGVSALWILGVDFWRAICGRLPEGEMRMSRESEEDPRAEAENLQHHRGTPSQQAMPNKEWLSP